MRASYSLLAQTVTRNAFVSLVLCHQCTLLSRHFRDRRESKQRVLFLWLSKFVALEFGVFLSIVDARQ
ncbi:hypothetical protein [Photobacterium halotolerans]|uniref:hypothetical protein n=1 Tax=Photobacterium halotolerans TaxID=265726 RepID=UPI001F184238|nr:hypothetical protein [Photobacterium halotolerans]